MLARAKLITAPKISEAGTVELVVELEENKLVIHRRDSDLMNLRKGDVVKLDLAQFKVTYNIIR